MTQVRWLLCNAVIVGLCAVLLACSGGGGLITGQLPTSVSVALKPDAVEAGTSAMGTVTSSQPAPAGGFQVLLSSDNAAATFPAGGPIVIGAGGTSANFTVNTTTVSMQTVANITAMLMPAVTGASTGAKLTIDPATTAQVQSLTTLPTMVKGGMSLNGTVTLNMTPATGPTAVLLVSSNPAVLAFPPAAGGTAVSPGSVQIPIGNAMANFQIKTFPVTAQTVVTITATLNNAVIAMVTVTP